MDRDNPRHALMDYGAMLKARMPNPSRKCPLHETGPFRRFQPADPRYDPETASFGWENERGVLIEKLQKDPQEVRTILTEMEQEGFLRIVDGTISYVNKQGWVHVKVQ